MWQYVAICALVLLVVGVKGGHKAVRRFCEGYKDQRESLRLEADICDQPINLSYGEGTKEQAVPEIVQDTIAGFKELMKETLNLVNNSMDRQLDSMKEREQANVIKYTELVKELQISHNRDSEMVVNQLENWRLEREQNRGRSLQKLPLYDGNNYYVDEWLEKVEAIMICNMCNITKYV